MNICVKHGEAAVIFNQDACPACVLTQELENQKSVAGQMRVELEAFWDANEVPMLTSICAENRMDRAEVLEGSKRILDAIRDHNDIVDVKTFFVELPGFLDKILAEIGEHDLMEVVSLYKEASDFVENVGSIKDAKKFFEASGLDPDADGEDVKRAIDNDKSIDINNLNEKLREWKSNLQEMVEDVRAFYNSIP